MPSCSASSSAKMTLAGTYKNQTLLQNFHKRSHYALHDTSYKATDNCETRCAAVCFSIIKIACTGWQAAYTGKTQAGAPNKMRLSKLLHLISKQTVKPRGVGENVCLCRPTRRKQVRNWNRKNSASLFSLMRDSKQSNSTAYGGVQAGRCSKRPCHSLPYGVTNCCFFTVTGRYTKRDGWKEKSTDPELGQKFYCFDVAFCGH